jgi:ABC-type multidrug transport system fused ATPase/permease subunit
MDASAASRLFAAEWGAAVKAGGGKASLPRVLWRAFRGQFLLAAGLKLAWGVLVLTGVTYFVRTLLAYIRFRASDPVHTAEEASVGILHAIGFLLCTLLQSWAMQQMSIVSTRLGLRVESAVSAALYSKALRYDRFAQGPVDLVGLATKDCAKLREACTNLQFLWSGALEAVAIMVILLVLVGRAALPGLGVVLLLVPLQFAVGMATASARSSAIAAADTRVRLTDEVLRSIKLVKMYAYEDKFAAGVAGERRHEDAIAAWGGLLKAINYALVFAMPPIIALSIFGVHAQESGLEAGLAFTTLSLFNTLRLPLVLLPKGLRAAVEASSASARITDFLLAPEREGTPVAVAAPVPAGKAAPEAEAVVQVVVGEEGVAVAAKQPPSPPLPTGSIHMQAASFAYGSGQPLLQGLTLRLAPGSLTAITGTVGSGKSNLLAAVLGHMGTVAGSCSTAGSYAYVPQTSWCAHGTVRDNILFGRPWDEQRYRSTLFACALETDCGLLAEGDLTEIGERGMNLSGGREWVAPRRGLLCAWSSLSRAPHSTPPTHTRTHARTHAHSHSHTPSRTPQSASALPLLAQCTPARTLCCWTPPSLPWTPTPPSTSSRTPSLACCAQRAPLCCW